MRSPLNVFASLVVALLLLLPRPVLSTTGEQESLEDEAQRFRGQPTVRLPADEVFDLEQRRRALERRALEIDDRERQLTLLRDQLDERIREITKLQRAMDEYLNRWRKEEEARLTQLVKVYSAMKSDAAAAAIGEMEERLATAILARMNEKKAAKIMNLVPPRKAVNIADRMGRGLP